VFANPATAASSLVTRKRWTAVTPMPSWWATWDRVRPDGGIPVPRDGLVLAWHAHRSAVVEVQDGGALLFANFATAANLPRPTHPIISG